MQFEKNAGRALILSTLLMVMTMALHPVGGSFEHLLKVTNMAITAHSIAIVSIPFAAVGFWGLTKKLGTDSFFSISAFAIILFGFIAVMLAATVNGLALPIFILKYKDASTEIIASITPILKYNSSLNHAFDYIYMGTFCLAMLFWSIEILRTKKLSSWIAFIGIALFIIIISLFISGFTLTDLNGFRVFVLSSVLWIVLVGILLMRTSSNQN
ncbi:MAG TPA: hypothetical protein VKT28_06685 [Puia sp.]|nr:hypothetical protein [Puia sp.]